MALHDFTSQRLFVEADLSPSGRVACSVEQANYLLNVLRMKSGDTLLVFNGRDGEWKAAITETGKRTCILEAGAQVRPQEAGPDIDYLFAPLKRSRLDYMVQKATELGVARLRPVLTRRTIAERVNLQRMRANAIEAAEQCGILSVPEVGEPQKLAQVLATWDTERTLIFCDEHAPVQSPLAALSAISPGPLAVLIGPEGGFSEEERDELLEKSWTRPISLGPRVMRADTAVVAALALVNAALGDWR
jgi:16S rRNA (uracil1498-N3)-methyltransferase